MSEAEKSHVGDLFILVDGFTEALVIITRTWKIDSYFFIEVFVLSSQIIKPQSKNWCEPIGWTDKDEGKLIVFKSSSFEEWKKSWWVETFLQENE